MKGRDPRPNTESNHSMSARIHSRRPKAWACFVWILAFLPLPAAAQGTVLFNTAVVGARVYDTNWLPVQGPMFVGQLYAGPPGGLLTAVDSPVPFRTGVAAGYIMVGSVSIPGIAPGSQAEIEMRAWDISAGATFDAARAAGGRTGISNRILVLLGGGFGFSSAARQGPAQGGAPGEVLLLVPPATLSGLSGFAVGSAFNLNYGPPGTAEVPLEGRDLSFSCGIPVGTKLLLDFHPLHDGELTIFTQVTEVDAVLELFHPYYLAGSDVTRLGCTDLPDGNHASLSQTVLANQVYYITLAARNAQTGAVTLAYRLDKRRVDVMEFVKPAAAIYDGTPKTLAVHTQPQVQFIRITYNGLTDPPVNAGEYEVVAEVDDPTWGGSLTTVFTIEKASQSITDFRPPDTVFLGERIPLSARSTQALIVRFELTSGHAFAQISGAELLALVPGPVVLRAIQEGDDNRFAAPPVEASLTIVDPRPRLSAVSSGAGTVFLVLTGAPSARYAIESAPAISASTWSVASEISTGTSGVWTQIRQSTGSTPREFMRARWLPPAR